MLELGIKVTKVWLADDELSELHPKMEGYLTMLEPALYKYKTHYILQEHSLLNATTMELSESPVDLLQHILAAETDWSEPEDIGKIFLFIVSPTRRARNFFGVRVALFKKRARDVCWFFVPL